MSVFDIEARNSQFRWRGNVRRPGGIIRIRVYRSVVACVLLTFIFTAPAVSRQSAALMPNSTVTDAIPDSSYSIFLTGISGVGLLNRSRDLFRVSPQAPELNPVSFGNPLQKTIPDHLCPDCAFSKTGLYAGRMAVVTGIVLGAQYSVFYYEQSQWYDKYTTVKFHFDDVLNYAYNFDKLGHVFGTYAWALGVARLYEWAGMKPKTAALIGAAFGWAAQFQVEVYDGYIPRFGFDRFDIAANTIGAGWFYAQQRVQTLRNWHFRMGYYPEKIRTEDGSFFKLPADQILADDYSNQSYWMAVRLQNYLPQSKKKYWPSFLMLSGGIALDNWIAGSDFNNGHIAYYLSVDLDWAKILPQEYMFGRAFADLFNMFRLPFPALRLSPGFEFVPMYLGN
jgi:Predicted periplasmic lipoprotein (DUF2279)